MNVILINPSAHFTSREDILIMPPLGLLYIGAVLEREGHNVKILDCLAKGWRTPKKISLGDDVVYKVDVTDEYLDNCLRGLNCDVVGISCLFATAERDVVEMAKRVKKLNPSISVVVGGTNASVRYEKLIQEGSIDYIILGEGEYALNSLLKVMKNEGDVTKIEGLVYRTEGRVVINNGINRVMELNTLPMPAYHLLDNSVEEYFHGNIPGSFIEERILPVCTSRGCVLNCVFCSGKKLFGNWRARKPENVCEEIEFLKRKYEIKEIAFTDSNINVDNNRFVEMLAQMKKRKIDLYWTAWGGIFIKTFSNEAIPLMKETGCYSVFLSPEHGDPKMQEYIGKIVPLEKMRCIVKEFRKHGIWTHGNFVLGLPGENILTMRKCFNFAIKADFDAVSFHVAIPVPGSRFYEQIISHVVLDSDALRFKTRDVTWASLSGEKLNKTVRWFTIRFALHRLLSDLAPYNIIRNLRHFNKQRVKIYKVNGVKFLKLVRNMFS